MTVLFLNGNFPGSPYLLEGSSSPPMPSSVEETQKKIGAMLRDSTVKFLRLLYSNLLVQQTLDLNEFLKIFVIEKQTEISKLDLRTACFFKKMVAMFTAELEEDEKAIGYSRVDGVMLYIETKTQQKDLRRQYIEAQALEPVLSLIKELDDLKPSIVNRINLLKG